MNRIRWSLLVLLLAPLAAQAQNLDVTLENGKTDLDAAPVRVPLQWPKSWKQPNVVDFTIDGAKAIGQLTEPNFVTDKIKAVDAKIRKDLVFIATKLAAGKTSRLSIAEPPAPRPLQDNAFFWKETPNDHVDLVFLSGSKEIPVMRYMNKPYDAATPATRNRTYKVFHHLYDPAGEGKLVTNGGHTDQSVNEKDLLFPHHRGLMFGVNQCTYDGKKADTWHCNVGATHVAHVKTLFETAGPIMAEHRVLLAWHGEKDDVFAAEERQMTVYKVPGGTLIDFTTRLTPKVAKLHLAGDPQHAGFQFRAHNDVAKKTARQTYYLRTDGKGEPGKTINWDGKKAPSGTVNVPWKVLSFVLDDKRYSVELIDHPSNPGEKRYSERDYGRFGGYFVTDVTPENPLVLNHRVWLQNGEMTGEQAEKLRQAFVDPPHAATKSP